MMGQMIPAHQGNIINIMKIRFMSLTNQERDDLIKEYENRPQMWDSNVVGFQDGAYLLGAKCKIAKKFNWDSGMYTAKLLLSRHPL